MPITDEYTLRCETCGYAVDGLPVAGNCPECGRAIRTSLPEARQGTPWDRGPSVRNWFATGWAVVRRPGRTFDTVHVRSDQLSTLFVFNLVVASALGAVPIWVWCAIDVWSSLDQTPADAPMAVAFVAEIVGFCLAVCSAWIAVAVLLVLLTSIERRGLAIIGRVHGWRVTRPVSAAVCSHASFGWIAAGLMVGLVATSMVVLEEFSRRGTRLRTISLWDTAVPAAMLAGLLIFETLVYIGVRRCKFANRARPALEAAQPGPSPATQPHA